MSRSHESFGSRAQQHKTQHIPLPTSIVINNNFNIFDKPVLDFLTLYYVELLFPGVLLRRREVNDSTGPAVPRAPTGYSCTTGLLCNLCQLVIKNLSERQLAGFLKGLFLGHFDSISIFIKYSFIVLISFFMIWAQSLFLCLCKSLWVTLGMNSAIEINLPFLALHMP